MTRNIFDLDAHERSLDYGLSPAREISTMRRGPFIQCSSGGSFSCFTLGSHPGQARLTALALVLALPAILATTACEGESQHTDATETAQRSLLNGTPEGLPPAFAGFLFELEFPLHSLKEVPTWNELEQLLDNPYATVPCPTYFGPNDQGYPSVCSTVTRRPGFGVTLPPLLVHPLDYHPQTGEEMRLLNPNYPGGQWTVPDGLEETAPGVFEWQYAEVEVSPGAGRVEDDEVAIDYNSPHIVGERTEARYQMHVNTPEDPACIVSVEMNPPEGSLVCGSDPGEPPGYSVPALVSAKLVDPAGCAERNVESPGSCTGAGKITRLRKPSVRPTPSTPPNFLVNTDPNDTTPSNENDYIAGNSFAQRQTGRLEAMRMGKALFWDMQVGSDSVQSCGTCHFNAGADNRTQNQMNPNSLGGDLVNFDIRPPNGVLVPGDFPFHKLTDPTVAGDAACQTPIVATLIAGVLENNLQGGGTKTVCDAANKISSTNDVASSMGVRFGKFKDVPVGPTAFAPPTAGVRSLLPDLRWSGSEPGAPAAPNTDPIAGFQGLRRVEPRNTPTFIMTAMNFDNFWDGRARHDFNGGSVFGAADPQKHVFVGTATGPLTATRQIVRLASVASLATGPGLSEFEMSRLGRNWPKIGKKLLQGTLAPSGTSVTPLANQLVATDDSILGPYSNQGGTQCASLGRPTAPGKPGLCTTYQEMIQRAFDPQLWQNKNRHLNGCFTDGSKPACPAGTPDDPFDRYVLSIANGVPSASNTNQFTQMEANMSLFFGLSIHLWATVLMPDDAPFDRFHDKNPYAHEVVGEPGEPGLVAPRPSCAMNGNVQPCITEVGNFKRDAVGLDAQFSGTRVSTDPDPLLGMDIFAGSNLSGKNPNFRTGRCAECHLGPMMTDHNIITTPAAMLLDFSPEFLTPGVEVLLEPLGKPRVISGFLLESEFAENSQDAVERRIANQSIVPNAESGLAYPDGLFNATDHTGAGASFFDNGMYNLGVTPCLANQVGPTGPCDDIGRGDKDPFGWPLSLAALMLKNLGGPTQQPGAPISGFNESADPECAPFCGTGGLFPESTQDQQINPGFTAELEPASMKLPAHLGPFANNVNVGEASPEADEVFGGLNTITNVAMLEGFIDTLGAFDPSGVINEAMNNALQPLMGTCSPVTGGAVDANQDGCADGVVNRVGRMGSFKAPTLRGVELTGPYFHNGGKLTLRQVVDFYVRGGDHPVTNAAHRDFNLVNMKAEVQSDLSEAEIVALVDFLLELTDERVRLAKAPFDHPEVFVPLDGTAPENSFGRAGFAPLTTGVCAGGTAACFKQVPAVGTTGGAAAPGFLGVVRGDRNTPNCDMTGAGGAISHYCR